MKKTFLQTTRTQHKGITYSILISLVLLVIVVLSCEKQGKLISTTPGQTLSSAQHTNSSPEKTSSTATSISSSISKEEALRRINYLFSDELYPITLDQVQGVNLQQFTQWLRGSRIAGAEQQFLGPLLSSDVYEIVLLKNVKYRKTDKLATIALVSVPPELSSQYTNVAVLSDHSIVNIGRLAMWFKCDRLQPELCLCLATIGIVPLASPNPASECGPDQPCRNAYGEYCTGIGDIDEVISAF